MFYFMCDVYVMNEPEILLPFNFASSQLGYISFYIAAFSPPHKKV